MTSINEFNAFHERRKALEDAFFRDRDQQLLEKLRGELYALEERPASRTCRAFSRRVSCWASCRRA